MSSKTGIEWTDSTWNPIRGCSLVSEGCRNCYAMHVAARFSGPGQAYEGLARRRSNGEPQWTGEVAVIERHMLDPLRWREPRRIFVNSMSDLFHENVSDETIARVFGIMGAAGHHTYQILTKRPDRMRDLLNKTHAGGFAEDANEEFFRLLRGVRRPHAKWDWPLANVWLGVSVENQDAADERIQYLLETPATVRFISGEPLLGPVDLTRVKARGMQKTINAIEGCELIGSNGLRRQLPGLDWVIVGGESGPYARPMSGAWAIELASQCEEFGVPFFFKQWGEWQPAEDVDVSVITTEMPWHHFGDERMYRVGKKRAGRVLLGRTWDQFPEVAA